MEANANMKNKSVKVIHKSINTGKN